MEETKTVYSILGIDYCIKIQGDIELYNNMKRDIETHERSDFRKIAVDICIEKEHEDEQHEISILLSIEHDLWFTLYEYLGINLFLEMGERTRNFVLMKLLFKLKKEGALDAIRLLQTMVKHDTASIRKSFKIAMDNLSQDQDGSLTLSVGNAKGH